MENKRKKTNAYTMWDKVENLEMQPNRGYYQIVFHKNYLDIFFQANVKRELQIFIHFDDITDKFIDIELQGIEIHTFIKKDLDKHQESIVIKNKSVKNNNLFKAFSATLFDNLDSVHSSDGAYVQINKTINDYRDYFNGEYKRKLSEIQQQGLFGELSYIEEEVNSGNENVVKFWEGMNKNKHDFVYTDRAVEIKTTKNQTRLNILISNEKQLDDEQAGNLKLVVYRLEKAEAGKSIYDLYKQIKQEIHNLENKDLLESKLIQAGMNLSGDEDYVNFQLNEKHVYLVTEDFPKITKKTIGSRIFDVKYHLNLDGIEEIEDEGLIYKNQ